MALSRNAADSVAKLARESRFIFSGTVERASASSLSLIPSGTASSVVRIDHIHQAAPALRNQTGQEATVLHSGDADWAVDGNHRIFFTNPVLYGETMGVREVGTVEPTKDIEDIHEMVARVMEESRMEVLVQHLLTADAVFHGRVVGTHSVSEATAATASEHEPDWWVAEIEVARAVKGKHRGKVRVRYPNSRDVRWYGVPKPRKGEEAVFVVHEDGLKLGEAVLAILHPEDVLPGDADEARRIEGLMGRRRTGKKREE